MGSGAEGIENRGFYKRGIVLRHATEDIRGHSQPVYDRTSLIGMTRKGCNQGARDYSPAQFIPASGCGA